MRRLPSVERLAGLLGDAPRRLAVDAARTELARAREAVLDGDDPPSEEELARAAGKLAARLSRPSLRPVLNATGVILHTNLGRAPLPAPAVDAVTAVAARYCNLEYDLGAGRRSSRGRHLEPLLRELTGAGAALAVNNNAAAVMLALAAVAGGGRVLVSRGELVEIGGSFRVPDILAHSGAEMIEVGTTNRTRVADYGQAIDERTEAILRVHRSNFRMVGFASRPGAAELAELAAARGIALIDDLGSGALDAVHDEPTVTGSLRGGADLVCCSCDKLLGGPQAGILVGRADMVDRCRRHPLARAMRIDKLQTAALEATLRAHRDGGREAVPALAAIDADEEALLARAEATAAAIGDSAQVRRATAAPGGGSLPGIELEGPVCSIDPGDVGADRMAAALREGEPPVIARIAQGRVVLDPRTMTDEEAARASLAALAALG